MFRTKSRSFPVAHEVLRDQPQLSSLFHHPNLCALATLAALLFLYETKQVHLEALGSFCSLCLVCLVSYHSDLCSNAPPSVRPSLSIIYIFLHSTCN